MASTQDIIKLLLKEHECQYDEAVVSQLNEYAMSYMKSLLQTSEDVANACERQRQVITLDDLKIAMEIQRNQEVQIQNVEQLAQKKNQTKIFEFDSSKYKNDPKYKSQGVRLPVKDTHMLQKPNYQLIITQPQPPQKEIKKMEEEKLLQSQQQGQPQPQQRIKIEIPDFIQDF